MQQALLLALALSAASACERTCAYNKHCGNGYKCMAGAEGAPKCCVAKYQSYRVSKREMWQLAHGNMHHCRAYGSGQWAHGHKLGSGTFEHGVASGDPTATSVILWTRVTPANPEASHVRVRVGWKVYEAADPTTVVAIGVGKALPEHDWTLKVDITGLNPNTQYTYQFSTKSAVSTVGHTRTLPVGHVEQMKAAVVSCQNYMAGYFHVYEEIAKDDSLDVVFHLGDYVYEFGVDMHRAGFGRLGVETVVPGREVTPSYTAVSLGDYRARYNQVRGDASLQKVHAKLPFVTIWDDHEVADDAWVGDSTQEGGSHIHSDADGSFDERRAAGIQAYFEWLPIRPTGDTSCLTDDAALHTPGSIYRSFVYGDLVNMIMIDTRYEARDESRDLFDYVDQEAGQVDFAGLFASYTSEDRDLIGAEQLDFVREQFQSETTWHVLGSAVQMARLEMPAAVIAGVWDTAQYAEYGGLAVLAGRAQAQDPTLTPAELVYLEDNVHKLTPEVMGLLQLPKLPYALDSWDGYPAERERVLAMAKEFGVKLVVLAGDSHNAWTAYLTDDAGEHVATEFATPSISSPGLETFFFNAAPPAFPAIEAGLTAVVESVQYLNVGDRGYMTFTVTHEKVTADYTFVSSVMEPTYTVLTDRQRTDSVSAATYPTLTPDA